MLIFGGEALLRWFDPVRPLLAQIGIGLLCLAIRVDWRRRPASISPPLIVGSR